jgi:LysR family cys regulon transcriptional activator
LLVPSYHWDRKIIVPRDHELAALDRKLTLKDLAQYPLVAYLFSFGCHASIKRAFAEKGLKPDVVFTARDEDVIKAYVRMGFGVGIVASMAESCDDDEDLAAVEAGGLFPRSTTWIGFRKDIVLRRYMLDFVQLFAPHITTDQLEQTRQLRSQADIDRLFDGVTLPIRGGCINDIIAAA